MSEEYKVIVNNDGDIRYYKPGTKIEHRLDGPAIENNNGDKWWIVNDELHRTDGPAIEMRDGYKAWWINNKLHREDGPAVIWQDGKGDWYLEGVEHTEKEFIAKTRKNTITIDGKTVEVSAESFVAIQNELV